MAAQDFRVKNGIVVAGNAELTGILYPTADGTNRQVIMTDGAGTLSFEDLDTLHTEAVNQTTSLIAVGTPVYQVGTSGNAIEVAPADASDPAKMPAIGVAETDLSANGGTGFVIHMGQVSGVDTSTFSEGDTMYVAVGGGFTNTPPTGESNLIQNLGRVTKVHATSGGGIVMGAGRSNAVPNLNNGNIFIGNASNQAETVSLNTAVGNLGYLTSETNTTLALNGNSLDYTDEQGNTTNISLAAYLDDTTNTVLSASLSGNTITFTREDATQFTLDVSNLYDDTNLVTSVNSQTGAVSLGIDDLTDVDTTTAAPTNGDSLIWNGTNFVPGASFSQSDFDTAFAAKDTGDLSEGTNLYYTDARADARIAAASIDDLTDVDTTSSAPTSGQALVWNGTNFVPGDVTANFLGLTDTPASFGTAGQAVIVNSGATGLEFGDVTADFIGLTDSPASYTGGADRVVKVNASETGIEFGDIVTGQTAREYFVGDGTTTDFTLTNTYAGDYGFMLFVDGVIQKHGSGEDYTVVNGTTLTFNSAPLNNAEISLFGITPIAENVPIDGSVTAAKLATSAYTRDTFSGNNSTTSFTLTRDPGSVYSPFIFVDGVIQDPITHYTISGTTLTFTFTPAAATDNIVVIYGPTNVAGTVSDGSITHAKLAPSNFDYQIATGDGTTTDFALDQTAVYAKNIIVTVAGVPQAPDGTTYTVTNNGNTLSFTSAPANGAKIVIRWYATATVVVPGIDSITTAMIQDGAITSDKIATGGVATVDMADGSVTSLKIANGGIATVDIADAAITPQKLDREYATKGTSIALSIALG